MIRRVLLHFISLTLIFFIMTGCTGSFKPKTVVIPDAEANAQPDEAIDDFKVDQIYTLFDHEDVDGAVLGWLNKDHLLGTFYNKGKGRSFELMDYGRDARQQLMTENGKSGNFALSPDGSREAEIFMANGLKTEKLRLIQWTGGKPAAADIAELQTASLASSFGWSNNSRYLSYIKKMRGDTQPQIVVYDTQLKQWGTYPFSEQKTASESYPSDLAQIDTSTYVKISDDGKSALILEQSSRQPYLLFGSLDNHVFTSKYERDASRDAGVEFVDNAQIMFVGSKGSLYLYDSRNATTATLMEGVGTFRLSDDRKYIAYTKDQVDLYAARLQGNNMTNEQSLYKGSVPFQIDWSPDNGKILLVGNSVYPSAVQAAVSDPLPLVLEFKR